MGSVSHRWWHSVNGCGFFGMRKWHVRCWIELLIIVTL